MKMASEDLVVVEAEHMTNLNEDIASLRNRVAIALERSRIDEGVPSETDVMEVMTPTVNGTTNSDVTLIDPEIFDIIAEEDRLIRIIRRIQNQRNRACYQNILEFARRENKNRDMEVCKQLIKNLMEKNLITNNGKNDTSESFKIVEKNVEKINVPKSAATKMDIKITESNEKIAFSEEKDTLNGLGSYINERFHHNVLINLIKKEVDVAVSKINTKAESLVNNNSYIKDIMVFQTKEIENLRNQLANIKNGNDIHNENPMKDLITAQNKNIEFLRDELASKDKIIQMLLQEKDSNRSTREKCNKDTIIENREVSEKF